MTTYTATIDTDLDGRVLPGAHLAVGNRNLPLVPSTSPLRSIAATLTAAGYRFADDPSPRHNDPIGPFGPWLSFKVVRADV